MELLYPYEYFLELLEEDLYDFDRESCDDLTVYMDLDSTMDKWING
ncbi:hypothetical protein [Clostridium sp. Marseille-Q2269]|nr:hypothetical protein [Clostridium sp. Marseille-Q2269]